MVRSAFNYIFLIMKKGILSYCLLAGILVSCSKDNDKAGVNNCHIIEMKGGGQEYDLSYDASGRLETVVYNGYSLTSFTYSGNTITALATQNGVFFRKTVYTFNSDGLVTQARLETNTAGTAWQNRIYRYSGTQLTGVTTTESWGSGSASAYTWNNGNMVRKDIYDNGALIQFIEYEYYNGKPYQQGDMNYWDKALNGTETIRPKNLLKKVSSHVLDGNYTEISEYSYAFDGEDRIISMTETEPSGSRTFQYLYQCR